MDEKNTVKKPKWMNVIIGKITLELDKMRFRIYSIFHKMDDELYVFEVPDSEWNKKMEEDEKLHHWDLENSVNGNNCRRLFGHIIAASAGTAAAVIFCRMMDKKRRV